ncbi:two-component system NtrC family sensor kinase [Bradyrhizobium sp. USDA 4369]
MQTAQRKSLIMLRWMMVASLALPVALFLVVAYVSYGSTCEEADRDIRRSLDVVHEHAEKVLETIDRSLSEIDEIVRDLSDAEIKAREQALHGRLRQLSDTLPQMKSAWVFDVRGRPLVSSMIYPAPDMIFADRDYFSAHVTTNAGSFVGAALTPRPPDHGAAFFSVSRRRQSEDGRFTGVIQAAVLPDYFEHFYARIGRAPGSYFALRRFDGLVLARFPAAQRSAGPPPNDVPAAAADTEQLVTEISPIDGLERRVGYQRLAGFPVYVSAGLETATIRDRWIGTMGRHLIFGIPATALLVVFLAIARRRTERFYIEAARRLEAEDALRHGQRMEALGQLTGGVAHDFNNLLTVIRASADLLRRANLPEERRLRYIDAISDTVARASKLTSQLLAFARRQTLKPEVFDISRSVVTLRDMVKTLVGSRIEIVTSVPDEPCYVNADAGQFETALINIAVNARDAMAGQGQLVISVMAAPDLPTPAAPQERPPLGYVALAVQDTGIGIPQQQFSRIFEPFFTTKTIGQGTGLGLSQVFGFAKQSGGEIGVTSELGKGTTFTLYLPRVAPAEQPRSDAGGHALPVGGRGMAVLVVEDNIDVGRSATEALAELGYLTTLVDNARDALEELIDGGSRFDVVFTDVVMPGMTGLELAEEIRRLELNIPIVLASGYSHVLAQQGTNGFELLRKPYSIEELSRVLHKVVPVPLHRAPPVAPSSEMR